jgi:hypothetical protein
MPMAMPGVARPSARPHRPTHVLEKRLHVRHLFQIFHDGCLGEGLVVVTFVEALELHGQLKHGLLLLVELAERVGRRKISIKECPLRFTSNFNHCSLRHTEASLRFS